jgi:hypothetical protein
MPGLKNNQAKKFSKKGAAAKKANEKAVNSVLEGQVELVIGRVDANLGSGGFKIVVNDGSTATGIPRGLFNFKTMRIERNSFVLMEPSSCERVKAMEIVGVLDRKDAQRLYKEKRISKVVWSTEEDGKEDEDDLFDYDGADKKDEEDDDLDIAGI